MTLDLPTFLRARLDEDAGCQKRSRDTWHHRNCESLPDVLYPDRETGACDCGVPEQVLAEVEAKRKVIAQYVYWDEVTTSAGLGADMRDVGMVEGLEEALRYLALPYAGHEDYDESWRPSSGE